MRCFLKILRRQEKIKYQLCHCVLSKPTLSSSNRQSGDLERTPSCSPRLCELFGEGETGEEREGPSSGIGYYSGTNLCRRTVIGENAGCFQEDMAYNEQGKITVVDGPEDNTNWGECAAKCAKNADCKFWSLATSSCTNCRPGECKLFGPDAKKRLGMYGHIAGAVDCQDILFSLDTHHSQGTHYSNSSAVRNILRSSDLDAPPGRCLNSNQDEPKCPAQEVPGYRFVNSS